MLFFYLSQITKKKIILNDYNLIIYTYYDYKNKLYNFVTHEKIWYYYFLLTLHLIITNYKKILYLIIKVVLFIVIKITKISYKII